VRLLERDAEWAALASEGRDVDSIVSYWTDDAVMFPPDLPAVTGRIALREYVEASSQIPGCRPHLAID
jgi:ketosteroid isomerase-like protein